MSGDENFSPEILQMLSKIFSFGNRKTGKRHADAEETGPNDIHSTKRPFPQLEQDEIRVLVFRDCDRKGKTLLFDSKAVKNEKSQDMCHHKGSDSEQKRLSGGAKTDPKLATKSQAERPKLPHARPSQDATMLGEMIFGSVAMTYKGQTVKVHEIRTPHQLLLTNVFAVKPRIVMPNCCDSNDYLSTSSQTDSLLDDSSRIDPECGSLSSQTSFSKEETGLRGISSKPVDVPGSSPIVVIDADGDSGLTASVDSNCLDENLQSVWASLSSSCGSYHRRLHRSRNTSIDRSFGKSKSEELSGDVSPVLRRRPKLGIGIILSLGDNEEKSRALQGFFFAHFPLFESHVKRLRLTVENACFMKTKSFTSQVIEAVNAFKNNIQNLLAAPRLKEPVWLNMMNQSSHRSQLCEKFMVQFIDCLQLANTKETNFFMASVLSAVLQQHLTWVSTVMPAGTAPCRAFLDKHSSKTLDLLAQSHPYNPLWAQLGDLYGAVGFPLRVTKTVVIGKDSKMVEQIVNALSYFIRCTEVVEHVQQREQLKKDTLEECFSYGEEENTYLHNGNASQTDGEDSTKISCLTINEKEFCAHCKQRCGAKCELKENQDKDCIGDAILKQFLVDGMQQCSKYGISKTVVLGKICEEKILLSKCTCNGISSSGFQKELKHFIKDSNHCDQSFRCYCCQNLRDCNLVLNKESLCEHSCEVQDKHCENQDSKETPCIGCLTKRLASENCNSEHQNSANECLRLLKSAQDKEVLEKSNSDMDCRLSDRDSCFSDNQEPSFVRSSVLTKRPIILQETIASHGRSGSADSGIHQSPLNSPNAQQPQMFPVVAKPSEESLQTLQELSLPDVLDVNSSNDSYSDSDEWRMFNNFGRSLFAGVCDSYMPDFVLQGVPDNDFYDSLSTDLKLALQHSVVDEPVSEAVCILANIDKWTCKLVSVKKNRKNSSSDPVKVQMVETSSLVFSMLSSLRGLWDLKMSAEFCLMHLEDKLKEIYLKSVVLSEILKDRRKPLLKYELAKMLSVEESDIPLLLSVASTHTPHNVSLGS